MADDPEEHPKKPDWGGVRMTPLAQQYYEKYVKWLQEDFAAVQATPLMVLVWGPGPAGGELYEKRQQIRGRLRLRGDTALFSEDLDDACAEFKVSSRAKELLQAHRADFIVVLYGSPGSIGEVHAFGNFLRELGSKMLIFVDARHVEGYGYTGLLAELRSAFNNVQTFIYPTDIQECHLVGAVEEKLKTLRLAKWWARRSVGLL